jgi:hypothetical protein
MSGNCISITSAQDCTSVNVVQDYTSVVHISTGPLGPKGDPGPSGSQGPSGSNGPTGSSAPFIYVTGSLWSTTSSIRISGALNVFGGITGSLFGTSSYALDTPNPNRIFIDGITASVNMGPNLFLITSGSSTLFSITNQGSATISSSASEIFLIRNQSGNTLFQVSQSGVVIFSTQSIDLSGTAPAGGVYFTSGSLYVGLE